jgi:hypothetical protein
MPGYPIFAAKWIEFEKDLSVEISQTQKTNTFILGCQKNLLDCVFLRQWEGWEGELIKRSFLTDLKLGLNRSHSKIEIKKFECSIEE